MIRSSRRALGLVAALGLGLAAAAPRAEAQPSPLDRIVGSRELRVAMSGRQPPFNATGKDGALLGLEVDLARALGEALGVDVTFVTQPFPSLLDLLAAGGADVVMSGMAITPERNLQVPFAGPYLLSGKSILTKSPELAAATSARDLDLPGLKLAALANSTSQSYVERFLPRAALTTTDDYDAAVMMVLDRKVDALVADMPVCALSVLRFPAEGLATLEQPLTLEPIGVAVAPGDPLLLNLIENYLNALETTGELARLRAKWLKEKDWLDRLP